MKIKVKNTGEGMGDGKFRCLYEVTFKGTDEFNNFVDKLQYQPAGWNKTVAWSCSPKLKIAEAYVEIKEDKKKQILIELNEFVNKDPQLSRFQKIWSYIKKPYWWWKTRKLKARLYWNQEYS